MQLERVDRALDVVEDRPRRLAVPRRLDLRGLDIEIPEPVLCEVELVDHRRRPEHDVVAVADVDPGAERARPSKRSPPTSSLASRSSVGMPARARYAAQMSPLWPAPITIAP